MDHSKPVAILLVAGLAAIAGSFTQAGAQFGPVRDPGKMPQAEAQEELDQYLEILTVADEKERIAAVDKFARLYPDSALLGTAYQYEMLAYESMNDAAGVIRAGRKALPLLRDNLKTLLTLSSVIANVAGTGREGAGLLEEAEGYARRALSVLEQFRVPREFSLEQWERMHGEMRAQAHESLGHIAGKRGDWQTSVAEFQEAVACSPVPQGTQYFRLGVACVFLGQRDCASAALQKAVELGPEGVRTRAQEQLSKLADPQSGEPLAAR